MMGSFTARIGALAVVYVVAALLGLRFAAVADQVTAVWPATAVPHRRQETHATEAFIHEP